MKGMNTTLILNESDNQQSDTLKSIFLNSCTKNSVSASVRDSVIMNGMPLFEINTAGDIFPLNTDYPTMASYVLKHRGDNTQADDTSDLTKEQQCLSPLLLHPIISSQSDHFDRARFFSVSSLILSSMMILTARKDKRRPILLHLLIEFTEKMIP